MWVSLLRENGDPWVDITGRQSLAGQWQGGFFRDCNAFPGVSLWEEMAHQVTPKVPPILRLPLGEEPRGAPPSIN